MTRKSISALALLLLGACAGENDPSNLGRDGLPLGGGSPTCDHGVCQEGGPLTPSCDSCSAAICAQDSYCCQFAWDSICVDQVPSVCNMSCTAPTCAHDLCDAGTPLDPTCDACAARVCTVDPYCCSGQWDRICIQEVDALCMQACHPSTGNAVDLLFIVDNSCSMSDQQTALAAQAPVLFSYLASQNFDYQIAITTTDVDPTGQRGAFVGNPPIIDLGTPNAEQAFANNVDVGVNGSGIEQGLEATRLAITSHPTHLRSNASLVVIVLSDEEDQSPDPPAVYESFLLGLKTPPQTVTLNAIVGTSSSSGCFSGPGLRYQSAAAATGGTVVSICAPDWSPALTGF